MRILLVHDYGTPTGGAENQMLRLRELLRERGHEARLFSSRASLIEAPLAADYSCFGSTSRLQVLTQTVNWSAYRNLKRVLTEFQPDLVHVRMFLWQLSPAILPLLRDLPAIYQTATYKSVCPAGTKILPDGSPCHRRAGIACLTSGCLTPQTWSVLMLQQKLWWQWRDCFDAVAALSHTMKDRLEANGLRPVEVIYNGVPERPARPPLGGAPTIAYAGRLSREKGLFVLIEALDLLRARQVPFRFLVAGDGPLRSEFLQELSKRKLDSQTDFLGYVPRDRMEREFDRAWVQAIPSLWDEPFGNVATEAMVRGTAVVTSAVGGLGEIVEDGRTGLHVPPGEPEALASALERFVLDRDRAETLGRAGRERALRHFTETACVDSFLKLYRHWIDRYANRTRPAA